MHPRTLAIGNRAIAPPDSLRGCDATHYSIELPARTPGSIVRGQERSSFQLLAAVVNEWAVIISHRPRELPPPRNGTSQSTESQPNIVLLWRALTAGGFECKRKAGKQAPVQLVGVRPLPKTTSGAQFFGRHSRLRKTLRKLLSPRIVPVVGGWSRFR